MPREVAYAGHFGRTHPTLAMSIRLPRSVTFTLVSVLPFLISGSLFVLLVYGIEVPSPFDELMALSMLLWPPFVIAAIVTRRRVRREWP